MRTRSFVFAAALMVASCAAEPRFEGEPLAICGNNRIRIIDWAKSEGDSVCVLWDWQTDDPDFLPTDDCKPIDNWHKLLVTSSKQAAAIISTDTGEILFQAYTPMAHSIEMLPGNRIAVALSTREGGNSLEIYDLGDSGTPIIRDTMYSGHGVVWNEKNRRLYTLNYYELREYRLRHWRSDHPSIEKVASWPVPSRGGHDLMPYGDGRRLLVTDHDGTYVFDPQTGGYSDLEPLKGLERVKSVNRDPATGRIIYTKAEVEWWTFHIYQKDPDKVVNINDIEVYKVRR